MLHEQEQINQNYNPEKRHSSLGRTVNYVFSKTPVKYAVPLTLLALTAACGSRNEGPIPAEALVTFEPPVPQVQNTGVNVNYQLSEDGKNMTFEITNGTFTGGLSKELKSLVDSQYEGYLDYINAPKYGAKRLSFPFDDGVLFEQSGEENGVHDKTVEFVFDPNDVARAIANSSYRSQDSGDQEFEQVPQGQEQLLTTEQPQGDLLPLTTQVSPLSTDVFDFGNLQPFTVPSGPEGAVTESLHLQPEAIPEPPLEVVESSTGEVLVDETSTEMIVEFPGVSINKNRTDMVKVGGKTLSQRDIDKALDGSITGGEGDCEVKHEPPVGEDQSLVGYCSRDVDLTELAAELGVSLDELNSVIKITDINPQMIVTETPVFQQTDVTNVLPLMTQELLETTTSFPPFESPQKDTAKQPQKDEGIPYFWPLFCGIGIVGAGAIIAFLRYTVRRDPSKVKYP